MLQLAGATGSPSNLSQELDEVTERLFSCRFLACSARYSHGGTGFLPAHSPRLSALASRSSSASRGDFEYLTMFQAQPSRTKISFTSLPPTKTSPITRP